MNCKNCGKPLKRKGVYCNNKCQKDYEYSEYIRNWKIGKINGLKGKSSF